MPLISGSLTAARTPSSSARPIWCLVRGRITPPRRAVDTLVTLSSRRLVRTNTLDEVLRYHWVGSGLCGFASGATE